LWHPAPDTPCPAAAEVSAYFAAQPDAARAARQFVVDALGRWGHVGLLLDDAQLVVSELVTNAVVHAGTPFLVAAQVQESGIRLSVRDANTARPTLRDGGQLAPSGRGLRIVATLASNWGVDVDADGKTVWADLRS
jgi:anti-sigma regulatory factor (Ser/Thr protein kinase)